MAKQSYPAELHKLHLELSALLAPRLDAAQSEQALFEAAIGSAAILGRHLAMAFSFIPDDLLEPIVEGWVTTLPAAIERAKIARGDAAAKH